MSLHSLIHEIHIASSEQLSTLKGRVIDSGLAGPALENGNFSQYYNLAYSHVWREFNRKCYNFGLTNLMVTPYDGGFRPVPPALSSLSNETTTTTEEPTTTTTEEPTTTTTEEPTTTTQAPRYQFIGDLCNGGGSASIWLENDSFSSTYTAYANATGPETYNGYFIYNGTVYLYNNGFTGGSTSCPEPPTTTTTTEEPTTTTTTTTTEEPTTTTTTTTEEPTTTI